MPIKVLAVGQGTYRGRFYNGTRNGGNAEANTFWLVDIKDPESGQVLQSAEEALAHSEIGWRDPKTGKGNPYAWLRRVEGSEAEGARQQKRAEADAERALEEQQKVDGTAGTGKGMRFDAGGATAEPSSVPGPNAGKPGKRESDKSVL